MIVRRALHRKARHRRRRQRIVLIAERRVGRRVRRPAAAAIRHVAAAHEARGCHAAPIAVASRCSATRRTAAAAQSRRRRRLRLVAHEQCAFCRLVAGRKERVVDARQRRDGGDRLIRLMRDWRHRVQRRRAALSLIRAQSIAQCYMSYVLVPFHETTYPTDGSLLSALMRRRRCRTTQQTTMAMMQSNTMPPPTELTMIKFMPVVHIAMNSLTDPKCHPDRLDTKTINTSLVRTSSETGGGRDDGGQPHVDGHSGRRRRRERHGAQIASRVAILQCVAGARIRAARRRHRNACRIRTRRRHAIQRRTTMPQRTKTVNECKN